MIIKRVCPPIAAWPKADRPVEIHLHQNGDHGFGIGVPGTTALDWLDGFRRWLDVNGLLQPDHHPQ